jgi:hypothetical protein
VSVGREAKSYKASRWISHAWMGSQDLSANGSKLTQEVVWCLDSGHDHALQGGLGCFTLANSSASVAILLPGKLEVMSVAVAEVPSRRFTNSDHSTFHTLPSQVALQASGRMFDVHAHLTAPELLPHLERLLSEAHR